VPAYRPLPEQLTKPLSEPPPPPERCTYQGQPAVCALDGLLQIEDWRGVQRTANADRATSARIAYPQHKGNP
jgi:hypothetical protein